jgi:hypothetical protein
MLLQPPRFHSRLGFSLMEIVLAVSLLTMVVVTVGKNFLDTSRAYSSLTVMTHMTSRALMILDRLEADLITGQFNSIAPTSPYQSSSIQLKKIIGVTNGVPSFGNPIHIESFPVESNPNDGLDNNKNGLVDEDGLRIWEDFPPYGATPGLEDMPVVLSGKLVKNSLHFTQDAATIEIEMTLQEVTETGQPPKTFHILSAVKIRN